MKKKRLITRDRSNPDRMDDDDDDMHSRPIDYPNNKSPEVDMYPAYNQNQQANQASQGSIAGVITSIQPADMVAPASQPGVFYVLPQDHQGTPITTQAGQENYQDSRGISIQYTSANNYSPNYNSPLMIQSQNAPDPNHQVQIEVENSNSEDIVYQ